MLVPSTENSKTFPNLRISHTTELRLGRINSLKIMKKKHIEEEMRKLCKLPNSENSFKCFLLLFDYLTFLHSFNFQNCLNIVALVSRASFERVVLFSWLPLLCKYFVIRSKLNGKVINFPRRIGNSLVRFYQSLPSK